MMKIAKKSLFIAHLVLAVLFFCTCCTFAAKSDPKAAKAAKDTKAAQKKKIVKRSRKDIKYTGFEAKTDPFMPPAQVAKLLEKPEKMIGFELEKPVELPNIELQGIIGSKKMPQAIISGSVMKVGDYIEDFQIKEISKNGVLLFLKGKEYMIKMQDFQSRIKQEKK